jgi:serralysin
MDGKDTLSGGNGNDLLDCGTGNDKLTGGTGLDIFRFSSALSATTNVDTLTDFNAVDDILQLENAVFTKFTAPGGLSASNFRASSTGNAADSNDYVLYETDTGQLFYDADGSGAGVKVLFATLSTLPALTSADIFVT